MWVMWEEIHPPSTSRRCLRQLCGWPQVRRTLINSSGAHHKRVHCEPSLLWCLQACWQGRGCFVYLCIDNQLAVACLPTSPAHRVQSPCLMLTFAIFSAHYLSYSNPAVSHLSGNVEYILFKKKKKTRASVCITQETASWDSALWTFVKLLIPTSVVCLSLPIGDEHLHQWQGHPKNHGGPQSEPDCHLQCQQPAGRRCQDHQCFLWYACLQHNSQNQIRAVCSQHYSNLETISFLLFFLMILGNQPNPDCLTWPCTNQLSVFCLFFWGLFAALLCRKQAGYWWLDDCVTASATSQLERILPVAFSFNLIAGASF